jgi:hypothetical protein
MTASAVRWHSTPAANSHWKRSPLQGILRRLPDETSTFKPIPHYEVVDSLIKRQEKKHDFHRSGKHHNRSDLSLITLLV